MKNKIKKRIKSIMEGILFEPVSKELFENLCKKIERILREEDYEYRSVKVLSTIDATAGDIYPMPSVEIYPAYGRKIVVSLQWEGHNVQK